jgi:gluconate kinase
MPLMLLGLRSVIAILALAAVASLATQSKIYVLFGRPGCGKTTVADAVLNALHGSCSGLDLDVFVTDSMKRNFGKGIYPSADERESFIRRACQSLDRDITDRSTAYPAISHSWLVSFSFVNCDMRDIFRTEFPSSKWILLDSTPNLAEERMQQRQGHFYKGGPPLLPRGEEWLFAPVEFDHLVLSAEDPVDHNCAKIIEEIIIRN